MVARTSGERLESSERYKCGYGRTTYVTRLFGDWHEGIALGRYANSHYIADTKNRDDWTEISKQEELLEIEAYFLGVIYVTLSIFILVSNVIVEHSGLRTMDL